jgi:membrane-anchored glycerophosphoryl diester phosphodiesterase (GDPDase)
VTIWSAVRGAFGKYFQVLGFYFLLGLMIVLFCLFPLWAWIAVNWVVVLPVMFIEKSGLFAAMGRSWRLVQGRWWRTFFILLLMYVLNYVISLALGAFLYIGQILMTLLLSPYLALAIYEGAVVLVSALVIPVQLIAVVLIYFDLRVRKEAIDLFQLAQQTTVAPPSLA